MIVGICGEAGVGKDTAAEFIAKEFGFATVAFADKVKRILGELFGFQYEHLWGPSAGRAVPYPEYHGLTARRALQTLGTDWGRECYPDVWVEYAMRVATQLTTGHGQRYSRQTGVEERCPWPPSTGPSYPGVVIPDVRFPNEAEAIVRAGGAVLRLYRPTSPTGAWAEHISERAAREISQATFAQTIVNNGSLEDLREQTCAVVRQLIERRRATSTASQGKQS